MILTISGDIGSGKSTCGKIIAKQLDYHYLSTGSIQRKLAEERGLTTLEMNLLAEKDSTIDDLIDGYTRALNTSEDNYIVDSRLAWHFIPKSYKVYLLCDENIAAQRIFGDRDRKSDEERTNVEDLLLKIMNRRKSEKRRFLEKYGIDFSRLDNYDQIIDTSRFTPGEIVQFILDGMKHYYDL